MKANCENNELLLIFDPSKKTHPHSIIGIPAGGRSRYIIQPLFDDFVNKNLEVLEKEDDKKRSKR